MFRILLLAVLMVVPSLATASPQAQQLDRLMAEARAELAALDALVDSAHVPAVRAEIHRKAQRVDQLMWEAQGVLRGQMTAPPPAPVLGLVVTGPGGEQAHAHIGGLGMSVHVDENSAKMNLHPGVSNITIVEASPPPRQERVYIEAPPPPPPSPSEMSSSSFQSLLRALEAESFDDGKMSVLRQAASNNWFNTNQVRQAMSALTFGDAQVDVGVMLYRRTVDQENFFQVYEVLTFDSERDDLRSRLGL